MKYLKPIILCIICGFLMGFFLYSSYDKAINLKPVFSFEEKIYFFKIGKYKNIDEMNNSLKNLDNYIYRIENNDYVAYSAITKSNENISKIKGYFKNLGYIVSEEEIYVDNNEFIKILDTYDEMLLNTSDNEVIENIINGVINKYKEIING